MESFSEIYHSIGVSTDALQQRCDRFRISKQNDLEKLRRRHAQRNRTAEPLQEVKSDAEQVQSRTQHDLEIVETRNDMENINVVELSRSYNGQLCHYNKLIWSIDPVDQVRQKLLRGIPHFDRLFEKTELYLPRYVYRVVHSGSAGEVLVHPSGLTQFKSQAYCQHESVARFELYSPDDIKEELRLHIQNCKRFPDRTLFASHWISTTDSLERAIDISVRSAKGGFSDICIYVIDTHSLRIPALVVLMALALRAWSVSVAPEWIKIMLKHGAFTEWIFWDEIRAVKVEKIDYNTFVRPQDSFSNNRFAPLEDIIPFVMKAERRHLGILKRTSRSVIHTQIYRSPRHEVEQHRFESGAWASRNGKLPLAPMCVQKDKRVQIDSKSLQDVWNIAKPLTNRSFIFVWILSLLTRKYYAKSIVSKAVERFPAIFEESLDFVEGCRDIGSEPATIAVYYPSGAECLGRVDVTEFQKMMLGCVTEWFRQTQSDGQHVRHGVKLYLMPRERRPARNLIRMRESNLCGNCTTEPVLQGEGVTLLRPSFADIIKYGQLVDPADIKEGGGLLSHRT